MAPSDTPTLGAGTKRSFSGTPLIGNNRMAALYQTTMVSIFVGRDDDIQEYQVPCGLLRASSEYFDKALNEHFIEGMTSKIDLPDVQPWVMECFIGWLYNQIVFWEHQDTSNQQPRVDQGLWGDSSVAQLKAVTEADVLDPIN
ncbi:hypothetical protein LTR15_010028 [Elasticomyces elasticus]|nr:hypothetical protein LTR15_010028 [Elasticomyces elasticus]